MNANSTAARHLRSPGDVRVEVGVRDKNDHTTHHPSGFWSYLGYTGTTRTWRSRWWYRQEKILKPETLPEPDSEVTTCVVTTCTLAPLVGPAAHRGASSRPPGPVRTPAVREPMGDRAALERVVLELRGGRPPEGPALADMIVDEELDFEQLEQLTLPEIREVPRGGKSFKRVKF